LLRCFPTVFRDGEPCAPGEQPRGAGCLLVVRVTGDPALVEHQQQASLRPPRRLPDVSAEQLGGLLSQGAVGVVKQLDVADAEFPRGRGQLGGPDLVQVAVTGPQGRRGAVREAQHGARRAASGEGRQGGTEPEALVIRVRAHCENR
jgi:hypothetical protein